MEIKGQIKTNQDQYWKAAGPTDQFFHYNNMITKEIVGHETYNRTKENTYQLSLWAEKHCEMLQILTLQTASKQEL